MIAVGLAGLLACRVSVAENTLQPTARPFASPPVSQPLVLRLPPTVPTGPRQYAARQVAANHLLQTEVQAAPDGEIPPPPAEPLAPLPSEANNGMTLDMVTDIALANSPIIREARNQLVAAQGAALQAGFYPNPMFNTFAPQLNGNQSQYGASMSQVVVTRGKIRLDASAAQRAAMAAEMTLVRARYDLLTLVRKRFYSALAMQRRVEVLTQMVDIARRSHDISKRLLQAGVGPRSDVLLLQIELSKAEAELRNANTLAETSRRQLAAATGVVNLQIERVAGDLTQALPDYDLIATQQAVLARNALLRRAEFEVARAQFQLRRAQVDPFPNLNMTGGYQRQGIGNAADLNGALLNQGLYEVQLIVPLYNQNQGNIRAAEGTIGAAVAAFNRIRTELANQTAMSVGEYIAASQWVDRYEREILPNATDVQNITAQLYNQGQVEFLRYLASQRVLLDASLAYIDAQERRWIAAADLAGLLQSEQFP
ncbi:MAG: TolC family protein [Pirellulales bacterium]